jgi:SAM-dependent methyltransferase
LIALVDQPTRAGENAIMSRLNQIVKSGDYTELAKDYSLHRPDYCPSVLDALLGLLDIPVADVDFVDVGAGTGIWTRMVYSKGVKSVTAIEPNEDMRAAGMSDSANTSIRWLAGRAEKTDLPAGSCDWLTMASSFHWTNFDAATREFHRLLRRRGRFTALWNARRIETNPLLVKIESHLSAMQPNIKRASTDMKETLTEQLWSSPWFEDVVYLEGQHDIIMTPERYLGVWRSVNELRVQLGEQQFDEFLEFVRQCIADQRSIQATYLTRAWSARRRG